MYTCMHAYYNVLASSSNSLILFMQTYGPSNLTGVVGGEPFKVGFEFGETPYYCTGGPGSTKTNEVNIHFCHDSEHSLL